MLIVVCLNRNLNQYLLLKVQPQNLNPPHLFPDDILRSLTWLNFDWVHDLPFVKNLIQFITFEVHPEQTHSQI